MLSPQGQTLRRAISRGVSLLVLATMVNWTLSASVMSGCSTNAGAEMAAMDAPAPHAMSHGSAHHAVPDATHPVCGAAMTAGACAVCVVVQPQTAAAFGAQRALHLAPVDGRDRALVSRDLSPDVPPPRNLT